MEQIKTKITKGVQKGETIITGKNTFGSVIDFLDIEGKPIDDVFSDPFCSVLLLEDDSYWFLCGWKTEKEATLGHSELIDYIVKSGIVPDIDSNEEIIKSIKNKVTSRNTQE